MTKEQAKQIVKDTIYKFIDNSENDEEIAMTREDKLLLQLNKSICSTIDSLDEEERKALEQRPNDDCVSRAELKKWLDMNFSFGGALRKLEMFDRIDKELPPVTPTQEWIPISSGRLPKEEEMVSITTEDLYLAKLNPCYGWRNGNYWHTFTANGSYLIKHPVAWQPLPQTYEEKRGSENDL